MARRVRAIPRGPRMAVIAAVAVVVTACAPPAPRTPSPEPVVTSVAPSPSATLSGTPTPDIPPSPSPGPTPSPSSTLNEEQAAAVATVLEFFRLKNELNKNPAQDVQPLADITTGQTRTIQISTIAMYREDGHVQTGDTSYSVIEVGDVADQGDFKTLKVGACTDATEVDLVDEDTGVSVLKAGRTYFVEWNIEVLLTGEGWKVGDITSESVEECRR